MGPITGGTCYNDFTFINPKVRNSADSIQNVTGCSIIAGGVFAYFDWVTGKNMWFAGGDGIGLDGHDGRQMALASEHQHRVLFLSRSSGRKSFE